MDGDSPCAAILQSGFVDGNLVQIKNRYIPMTMRNLFSMYYGKDIQRLRKIR